MEQTLLQFFARLVVVCTTLPIHEFAHGWAANKLGDDTAARQGRLTLNPIMHIDIVGGLLILLTGFGWARPVPVNPARFDRKHSMRAGMAITSAAGPLANVLLALVLMIVQKLLRLAVLTGIITNSAVGILYAILGLMVSINISLAVFNLLPIPPLDGYSIFSYFLPPKLAYQVAQHSQIIFVVVMLLCFSGILSTPISYISGGILWLLDKLTFFLG